MCWKPRDSLDSFCSSFHTQIRPLQATRDDGFRAGTNGDRERSPSNSEGLAEDGLRVMACSGLGPKLRDGCGGWVAAACLSLLLGHPGLKVIPGV